jgi:protoheme IX farnesyltransferase
MDQGHRVEQLECGGSAKDLVAVVTARRDVPPDAEGGTQALAARGNDPDHFIDERRRPGIVLRDLVTSIAQERREEALDAVEKTGCGGGGGDGHGPQYRKAELHPVPLSSTDVVMTRLTRFEKLAIATAASTIVLFAVGGFVRGTGSGLGCDTWPECTPGRLFPGGTIHSLIEFSHRFLVFVSTILVVLTAVFAWRGRPRYRPILGPAIAAIPLVLAQAVLGGIVVKTDLNPWWVTGHFAVALVFVADVVYVAVGAVCLGRREAASDVDGRDSGFARLTLFTAVVTFALLFVGTLVRAKGAGLAFTDWPLMNGRLVPALGGAATLMFLHRVLAALVFVLVLYVMVRARTMPGRSSDLVRLSSLLAALFVAQIVVGAAQVWTRLRPWPVVGHVALSVLIWATLVILTTVAHRLRAPATSGATLGMTAPARPDTTVAPADPKPSLKDTVTAYYHLTKPEIIFLLLVTTLPAMVLAAHRIPSVLLILATLVGGALAAGSANAINQYLDRDIDEIMKRTRRRPLPSNAVTPEQALRFGFFLGAISFFYLAITVNVLAAELALAAIAFYVFVYTMWLKRRTTQNIVIGGAAGAVPALVGWAAVTGSLAAPAWVLFAIIFVWTPPHFWALSLRYQGDYAAAGVPMLPVVRGEVETRRQIFLYSLVLFGTSLVLIPIGHMGPVYGLTAIVLGGSFTYRALGLWRTGEPARSWGLFKFSIWYLAALFAAVAVDALLPLSR